MNKFIHNIKFLILASSLAITIVSCSSNAEPLSNINYARSKFYACDRIGDYNEVRQCEIKINEQRYRNTQLQTVFQEQQPSTPDRSSEPVILAPNLP